MPARIVVVHDDTKFRECVVTALQADGYDIKALAGSMAAIEALEAASASSCSSLASYSRKGHRMAFHSPAWHG